MRQTTQILSLHQQRVHIQYLGVLPWKCADSIYVLGKNEIFEKEMTIGMLYWVATVE